MHESPATRTRWGLVLLLAATATAAYLCRVNISVAGALVMQEYGLTQTQMGWVFSAFLLGYTLVMLPGGLLADSWGAKRTLASLAWGWVAVTMLQAAVPSTAAASSAWGVIGALAALRFVMGALASPTYPAALEGVSRWTSPAAIGRANGLVIGSVGLGSAIAPPFITAVMVPWGWRAAMVASAVPALVIAAVWLAVRDPAPKPLERDGVDQGKGRAHESDGRAIVRLLRVPGFTLLTLSYTLQGYVGYIFIFWFYLYLVQVRHFSLVSGAFVASLPWVLSAISIPLGGLISDRLVLGRLGPVWGRRLIPIVGMGGAGVFISIGAHTTVAWIAAAALAVATALVLSVESPFWTTAAGIAGRRSGTGGGIMNTGCNIGGVISPMLTPVLGEAFGWEPALHLAAGLSILAAVLWFAITPPAVSASGSP